MIVFCITNDVQNTVFIVKSLKRLLQLQKLVMAEVLEQASQWHEMCCYDLEVMHSNPSQAELGVCSISALSRTWTKNKNEIRLVCNNPTHPDRP